MIFLSLIFCQIKNVNCDSKNCRKLLEEFNELILNLEFKKIRDFINK